jgi:hypothetical protein
VIDGDGANLMLQFRLEMGGDGIKRCQKIKRRQCTCLGSTGRSVTRCGGVTTSTEGEAAPGREKGGDDAS